MPDDAVLYGIIGGSTFGHEITHGFDDQGSQYDDKGNCKTGGQKKTVKNL
jgi:putative endopeptidase